MNLINCLFAYDIESNSMRSIIGSLHITFQSAHSWFVNGSSCFHHHDWRNNQDSYRNDLSKKHGIIVLNPTANNKESWEFSQLSWFHHYHYVHYDPLMMSQKEAPKKHPWVLPRKVAIMVWIYVQFSFVEYDGCFLGASYHVLATN